MSVNERVYMFLDDERDPPAPMEGFRVVVVRSFDEATAHVTQIGVPMCISFDHDLGDGPTGYDFAKWLVEAVMDGKTTLPSGFGYTIHSANPVGRENIEGLMNNFLDFYSDSEEY